MYISLACLVHCVHLSLQKHTWCFFFHSIHRTIKTACSRADLKSAQIRSSVHWRFCSEFLWGQIESGWVGSQWTHCLMPSKQWGRGSEARPCHGRLFASFITILGNTRGSHKGHIPTPTQIKYHVWKNQSIRFQDWGNSGNTSKMIWRKMYETCVHWKIKAFTIFL